MKKPKKRPDFIQQVTEWTDEKYMNHKWDKRLEERSKKNEMRELIDQKMKDYVASGKKIKKVMA